MCDCRLREEDGKLTLRQRCTLFDVDPGTLVRTKAGDEAHVDVEIA